MTRSYGITENPFIYGLEHRDYEYTRDNCGIETSLGDLPPSLGYFSDFIPTTPDPSFEKPDLTSMEKGAYYFGRTLRFMVSVPGTILDVALQVIEIVSYIARDVLTKLECTITGRAKHETFMNGVQEYSPVVLISKARKLTSSEPEVLATDLGVSTYFSSYEIFFG